MAPLPGLPNLIARERGHAQNQKEQQEGEKIEAR
jgi:hypothetical protein